MQFAKVLGTVVATQKTESLKGISLRLIVPCDSKGQSNGEPIVAADPIGVRQGDHVMWVSKREASLAIPGTPLANNYPLDAAITGIIDDIG